MRAMRRGADRGASRCRSSCPGRLYDDGVIDPRDTRTVLGLCLSVDRQRAGRGHRRLRRLPDVSATVITRLLVANRGEIARRVFRTCRDARHRHRRGVLRRGRRTARSCARPTRAVRLPGRRAGRDLPARRPARRRRAAAPAPTRSTPATASCPRTPTSPQAVIDAGLTWVGPPPEAIAAMGSKVEAKKLMAAAGVPVLPELDRRPTSTEADLPVLVKASAGGGGRGMRVVRDARRARRAPSTPAAARGGRRRSATHGLLRAVRRARAGTSRCRSSPTRTARSWSLGERECSIQRRHQKVVEEAPSPAVDDDAARRAARRGRRRGRGDRLRRRRHGRVPARARRRVLLPGDEHPPAGRAPGHRVRHRPRPGRAAARGRRGRARCRREPPAAARARRSRCGSTPRTRPRTGGRRAGGSAPVRRSPASSRSSGRCRGRASGWTPGSRPATRSARTTTRCWPR